jgi:hypothetical protein
MNVPSPLPLFANLHPNVFNDRFISFLELINPLPSVCMQLASHALNRIRMTFTGGASLMVEDAPVSVAYAREYVRALLS